MSKAVKEQKVPEKLLWEGEKDLELIKKTNDVRFGNISLYKSKRTSRNVFMKEKRSGDKDKLKQDIALATERLNMQHPSIQMMLGYSISTEKGLCSTNHFVKMFFDYPASDMRNELAERKKKKENLNGEVLSDVASNTLNGLDFLHSNGKAHGDIRPELLSAETIGHGKEINFSVMLDRLRNAGSIEKVQTDHMLNNDQLFMSPQLYKKINTKGKNKPEYNRQKNDLFSFGMSLLSLGNVQSVNDCYEKKGEFNKEKLAKHLENFKQKYQNNPNLCHIVTDLVEVEENNRLNPSSDTHTHGNQNKMVEMTRQELMEELANDNRNPHRKLENVKSTPAPPGMFLDQDNEITEIGDDQNHISHNFNAKKKNTHKVNSCYPPNYTNPNANNINSIASNLEYKNSSNPYPNNTTQYVQSNEKHYVLPEEEVIYSEPKIMKTYIDESSRRSYKGETQKTEVVKMQNVYDTARHEKTVKSYAPHTYTNTTTTTQPHTYTNTTTTQPHTYTITSSQRQVYTTPTTQHVNLNDIIVNNDSQNVNTVTVEKQVQSNIQYKNMQPHVQSNIQYKNVQPHVQSNIQYKNVQQHVQSNIQYTNVQQNVHDNYVKSNIQHKVVNKTKNLQYENDNRKSIQFQNLRFESEMSQTEPENRFEHPVENRVAESHENMDSFPAEGKVVRRRVRIKDAQGNVIKEYDEDI